MISIGSGCGNAFGTLASPSNADTPARQTLSVVGQQCYNLPQVIRNALTTDADRLIGLAPQSVEPLSVSAGGRDGLPGGVKKYLSGTAQ
jgi:hypothetical protein